MNYENKNEFGISDIINDTLMKSKTNKCDNIGTIKPLRKAHIFDDLSGRKFGKLHVIKRLDNSSSGKLRWLCECECGNKKSIGGGELRNGDSKSCGCIRSEYITNRNLKPPYYWMYIALLGSAKRSGKYCELTYDDILEFITIDKCHYCDKKLTWYIYGTKEAPKGYQIDRKDNSIGYIRGNCVVCCSLCNRIKGDKISHNKMLKIGKLVRNILEEET